MSKFESNAMFVERLLPVAYTKLATITTDALLIEAAKVLRAGTDLVIVCGSTGILVGVITKTDVVNQMSRCDGSICMAAASLAMSRGVVSCQPGDLLRDVWSTMKVRGLKNIPVVDADSRPLGILNALDILQVLLKESKEEESILRDYVMGIGYLN
jgi:CBS domain-containing protein